MELTFFAIAGCFFVAAEADVFGATVITDDTIITITNSLANIAFTIAACLRLIMFYPLLFSIYYVVFYIQRLKISVNNRFKLIRLMAIKNTEPF
jgi:uncharacterized membrane protein